MVFSGHKPTCLYYYISSTRHIFAFPKKYHVAIFVFMMSTIPTYFNRKNIFINSIYYQKISKDSMTFHAEKDLKARFRFLEHKY